MPLMRTHSHRDALPHWPWLYADSDVMRLGRRFLQDAVGEERGAGAEVSMLGNKMAAPCDRLRIAPLPLLPGASPLDHLF